MSGEQFDPVVGVPERLAPRLRRIVAPNSGPMTFRGTNTYLVGDREVAAIDPGPASDAHLAALLAATSGGRITDILVTHAHRDHSALAPVLAARTGAPVRAFGPAAAGRSAVMARLAAAGLRGSEGVDVDFVPDAVLADGDRLARAEWEITALWTPGHMGNHMAFVWNGSAFSGDLVMGWSTSVIAPPDGDAAAFRHGCGRLADVAPRVLWPGHGPPVKDPAGRIAALLDHRAAREAQVLEVLADRPADAVTLAAKLYPEIPRAVLPAATANVLAHLIDLHDRSVVTGDPATGTRARFEIAASA